MKTSLHDYFRRLPDPRLSRNKKHKLVDIIILSIIAIICGAESWDSIELFGKSKKSFLDKILDLPNGVPSHDTINRVFSLIRADKFEQLFIEWTDSLRNKNLSKEVIAIDGKTLRGSRDSYHNKSAIHLVNAWANQNQMILGQKKVDGKTNEITAIPELLEILDIEGCIITIDAIGTQTKIADKIIENKADYILSLKGNQDYLKQDTESIFKRQQPVSTDISIEKGHGRIETRKCEVIDDLTFLEDIDNWREIKSLIRITSERELNEKKTIETRLYISSLKSTAEDFNSYIRQHWGVENSLHWMLDVTFREDNQRKRNGKAAENFSLAQKMAINLLKGEQTKGISIKNKRLKAAWDDSFLLKILKI